ncbi:hypothetical protein GCM10010193_08180 [Kitasatospora atroaurantiaca]
MATVSTPVYEARSAWAEPTVDHRSSLLNRYGPPLAVDRAALDELLREAAREAGVRLVRAHAKPVAGPDGGWLVPGLENPVPVVVDATGTARAVSRARLRWHGVDRLRYTIWQTRPADRLPQPWSLVEAAPDGWWYSAPTPGSERLTVMQVQDTAGRAPQLPPPRTSERLAHRSLPRPAAQRVAVVGCAGPPWTAGLVAVGDAALSVDPLSSSGLRHALELAGPASEAALGLLHGDERPADDYARAVRHAFLKHLADRQFFHAAATRYQTAAFWSHRSDLEHMRLADAQSGHRSGV